MPKALCIAGMVVSALILLLFLADFVLNLLSEDIAPFKGASPFMDIVFILCAVGLGFMSWLTFKEQA